MSTKIVLPTAPVDVAEALAAGGAVAWEEPVAIRTYEPAPSEGLPVFSEARVYQGSSGRVYPLPFVESIDTEGRERDWRAIHLENELIRLMVLPELGGRIHIGYDKVAGYDFFYRNNVIKPALVGLAGPWISGGVEFNWPQHHRPATYLPVDAEIERADDGSVTVWCTDHDPFARMRASHGIRIRPGSSLIELRVRLHNRTSERQTFLWWANVAARSHADYQSFFPPDVHYVADHARRAVTAFPRADRPYYGVDYPARASEGSPDADRLDVYTNIPVPTSYMVLSTRDDFFGGYDHAADAGFVHWADRRIAPGKKQWTWGSGPFGEAWDRQLTDEDGPYVELMAGVFTDNQPDFSYLAPGEVREFSQYWYPISGIGVPLQATTAAAIAVRTDAAPGALRVGVAVPTPVTARVRIATAAGDPLEETTVDLTPSRPWNGAVPGAAAEEVTVLVETLEGEPLARWEAPDDPAAWEEPAVATEPPRPAEIASIEELYLTAVHLIQYRHPTRDPRPYLDEALRRDPDDARSLTAVAALAHRSGRYADALASARGAVARLTRRNPNATDTEAAYRSGLALVRLGRDAEALDAFGRAMWVQAWADAARIETARIEARAGRVSTALAQLDVDTRDPRAAAARVVLLRRLGHAERADATLADAIARDPHDHWLRHLAGRDTLRDARTLADIALEYRDLGETDAAVALLAQAAARPAGDTGGFAPLAHYLAADVLQRAGRPAEAAEHRRAAREADATGVFPSGLDEFDALTAAVAADAGDARAHDLLGIWLYDAGRREDALAHWRRARESGESRPTLLRNLALAAVTVEGDDAGAALLYDLALQRDPRRGRLLLERDILARRLGESAARRLGRFDAHAEAVGSRDDLVVLRAGLLTDLGCPERAIAELRGRELRAWEGGEGLALAAWDAAHCAAARAALAHGDRDAAVVLLDAVLAVPESLGEGRHLLSSLSEVQFLRGLARDSDAEFAAGVDDPADPVRHPERDADAATYHVGRCALALGDLERAETCWLALEERAAALRSAPEGIDYFATSVPEAAFFGIDPHDARRRADELTALARDGRAAAGALWPVSVALA